MPQETIILILILSILLSAFFAAAEMAFVTSNKFKVEIDKNKDNFTGRLLSIVSKSPSRFIGTTLIGNNIALVLYGLMVALLLEPPLERLYDGWLRDGYLSVMVVFSQTLISTMFILIVAEFLPKAISSINPNRFLNLLIIPITFFYFVLHFFVSFTILLSNFILRYIFFVKVKQEEVSLERTDLNYYLRQISNSETNTVAEIENEVKILQNALEFPSVRARDCMIPRTEIIGVEVRDSVEDLHKLFIESGLSKIMVYKESIDDIIGFAHSFDIFKRPQNIQSILIPILNVPETMLVKDILTQFIQQRRSVAIVVDEYGGTSGILTMEDIIEEIFGDIEDEHDVEERLERKISDHEYLFSARLEIDYLNETYNLGLPEKDEYTTLAGMVLYQTQDIPQKGDVIDIEGFKIIIRKVSQSRIEELSLILREG